MKIIPVKSLVTAALLCGMALAQNASTPAPGTAQQAPSTAAPAQPASPAAPASSTPRIAPGSVIPVRLAKSLDAKKLKAGDEVDARVTEDMKAGNGEVIVPKDTKVLGRVTEAQVRNKEQKESQLGIAFDHAVMKNGGDVPLPMSVQAIISPTYLSGGATNNGAADSAGTSPGSGGGNSSAMGNGRSGSMGAPQSSLPSSSGTGTADNPPSNAPRQPITGSTQGILGFQDLQLSNASDAKQGSVVTSEKNNVKLDSGTLLLLKVTQ